MKFRIHDEARTEAIDAANYYEAEQAGLGAQFTDVVNAALRKVERTPRRFAKLETVTVDGEIRRALLPKFPYLASTRFARTS